MVEIKELEVPAKYEVETKIPDSTIQHKEITEQQKLKVQSQSPKSPHKKYDLDKGDTFQGEVRINSNSMLKGTFKVKNILPTSDDKKDKNKGYRLSIEDEFGTTIRTFRNKIDVTKNPEQIQKEERIKKEQEEEKRIKEQIEAEEKEKAKIEQEKYEKGRIKTKEYHEQLEALVLAGITNIWMVGPAGCGKTTMANNLAKTLKYDFYSISCGIGTSSAEFIGYKYPQRESTDFAKYFSKPSIILIDEFTALDASVAQILNAALANGYINTTTGKVYRHKDCIIIATSNTFGQGANRQYVANNQLDASTIDRFIGGMIEVDYSVPYESKFNPDVVNYVWNLRNIIKQNNLRRVASTRMIIEGEKLKKAGITDWKDILISNWTEAEKLMLQSKSTLLDKFSKN